MTELSIIIPTLNEEDNIKEIIRRIKALNLDCDIIITDSDSKDKTREKARQIGKKLKILIKVINTKTADLSNSAIIGFQNSNSKYLALIDADLQHPPEMLPQMLQKIKEKNADIILASKYISGSKLQNSISRLILSKGFIYLTYIFFPRLIKIKDPSSGFFIFKKDLIKNKKFKPLGFRTLLEILVRTKPKKVIEVPYTFNQRKKGQSKANLKQVKLHLLHLKKLIFEK